MRARQLLALRSRVLAARWCYAPRPFSSIPLQLPPLRRPAPLQHHTRLLATSTADSYLVEVIKAEIEYELQKEAKKQGSLKGSTGPFELSDMPGTEEVILKRTFGKERIAVTCIMESQYRDENQELDLDENEDANDETASELGASSEDKARGSLQLNVIITKDVPFPALELECTYKRGDLKVRIDSVAFLKEDASKRADDKKVCQQAYEGPEFWMETHGKAKLKKKGSMRQTAIRCGPRRMDPTQRRESKSEAK